MAEVASLHVAPRVCKFQIIKSDQIFTIVYNKLKNDLRLPLASSVKELEQILQNWLNLNLEMLPGRKWDKWDKTRWFGVDGDADNFLRSVGSVQRRKRFGNDSKCSHKN